MSLFTNQFSSQCNDYQPYSTICITHTFLFSFSFHFLLKNLLESLKKAIILSLLAILFISVLHIRTTVKQQICLASPQSVTWSLILFRHLPLKAMSRIFGHLHRLQFPYLIRFPLLVLFVWVFKIKLHEAEDDHLENYTSIRNIFTRKLRSGVRPVDIKHQLVSQCNCFSVGTL